MACPGWPGGDTRPAVPHPCGYFDLVLAAALQSGPQTSPLGRRSRSMRMIALPWSMPSWAPRAALDAVAATDPILPLRMAAIYERLGQHVGSDQLIKIALDAVLAGIDSPALVQLAGLSRKEEPEAHELFALACDELGLTPTLPPDPGAACWELIRWLSELIVAGDLPPEDGVWLIEQSWLDACNPRITPPSFGRSSARPFNGMSGPRSGTPHAKPIAKRSLTAPGRSSKGPGLQTPDRAWPPVRKGPAT